MTLARLLRGKLINRQFVRFASTGDKVPIKFPQERDVRVSNAPPAEIISGAPEYLSTSRIVRIFKETPTATQSGHWRSKLWRIDWDILDKENKWENDMMGWASSGDAMQGTQLKFQTKQDATLFAISQGWDFYIQEPHVPDFHVKQYADNYLHHNGPLKLIKTK